MSTFNTLSLYNFYAHNNQCCRNEINRVCLRKLEKNPGVNLFSPRKKILNNNLQNN